MWWTPPQRTRLRNRLSGSQSMVQDYGSVKELGIWNRMKKTVLTRMPLKESGLCWKEWFIASLGPSPALFSDSLLIKEQLRMDGALLPAQSRM